MRLDSEPGAPRQTARGAARRLSLSVTIDETNLILEGLGHLPFARVYELIAGLQAQARDQLEPTETAPTESLDAAEPVPPDPLKRDADGGAEREAPSEIALASGGR